MIAIHLVVRSSVSLFLSSLSSFSFAFAVEGESGKVDLTEGRSGKV